MQTGVQVERLFTNKGKDLDEVMLVLRAWSIKWQKGAKEEDAGHTGWSAKQCGRRSWRGDVATKVPHPPATRLEHPAREFGLDVAQDAVVMSFDVTAGSTEFAAAHTGDLRRNFLADATDLIPFRGGGGAHSVANSADSQSKPAKVSSGRSISTRFI
jgi:hypothetical protein